MTRSNYLAKFHLVLALFFGFAFHPPPDAGLLKFCGLLFVYLCSRDTRIEDRVEHVIAVGTSLSVMRARSA